MPYPMPYPKTKTTPKLSPAHQRPHHQIQIPSVRISVMTIIIIWNLIAHEYLIWCRPFSITYYWLLVASMSFLKAMATSWPEGREGERDSTVFHCPFCASTSTSSSQHQPRAHPLDRDQSNLPTRGPHQHRTRTTPCLTP
jgi:hypothetical protein